MSPDLPTLTFYLYLDPARVINMPSVIYVPRKLPGIIRCPVDANPPVTSVKWEKDGYPLRVEKVCQAFTFYNYKTFFLFDNVLTHISRILSTLQHNVMQHKNRNTFKLFCPSSM